MPTDRCANATRPRHALRRWALSCVLLWGAASPVLADPAVEQLIEQSRQALQQGNARAAEIHAKNALQQAPQNADAFMALTRAYLGLEQPALALRQLEQARLMGADEAALRELTGRAYLQQQDFKRLLDQVQNDATFASQDQATLLALRGLAHLSLGHDAEAEQSLDEALALDSRSVDAHLGFARLALRDRNLERAETHLRSARMRAQDDVDVLLVAGELERIRGRDEQALQAFEQVLQQRPENTLALLGVAAVLLEQGKLREAERRLDVVLRNWPNHPVGNYLRGELAYRSGHPDAARSALRVALVVMPGHLPSHMLLGGLEFAEGRPEAAANHLARFVAARPEQLEARKLLVASYLQLSQPRKALEALKPALADGADDAQLHTLAGATLMRMGDTEGAARHYARAVELDPAAANARMELFVSLLVSQDPDAADRQLQQSIDLGTDPVQVAVMRTQLLLTRKAYDEALEQAQALQAQAPDNPAGYNLAGVAYLGKSEPEQAKQQFRKALQVAPDFSLANMNLASMALQASDPEQARKHYRAVLEHHPGHVGALQGLAEIARREGQTEAMLGFLEQARKASPSALEPRMRLYEYRLRHNDLGAALDLAQEMANSHPTNPEVLRALGIAQQGERLVKRAVETFARLVELQPESAEARALYADALASYGQVPEARKQLQEALRLDPDFLRARIGLGALEARDGDPARAQQIATEVQQRHPDHSAGFELEGDLHAAAGRAQEAARAFAEAYQRNRSDRVARKYFNALRGSGRPEQSYEPLRDWLSQHPDDVETRILLAKAYQVDGRLDQAAQAYQEVLQAAPGRADVMNNLAWIYLDRDAQQALHWAEKAYAQSPENPAVIDTYGWTVFRHGDPATGLGLLQEALLKAPQSSEIRFHVAQALEQVGDREQAHRHVKQILFTDPDFGARREAEAMLRRLEQP